MKRVTLADAGFEVSRLSFGTASLHHLFTFRARHKLLAAALDAGITHLDTSPYYGFGLAERQLGYLLGRGGHAMTIATKVGIYPPRAAQCPVPVWLIKAAGKMAPSLTRPEVDFSIARAESSLNESLKRLQRDYVDILFLHEPRKEMLNCDEFLTLRERLLREGKVRQFGLAGPAELFQGSLVAAGPLAGILQVKDSLEKHEADLITQSGRGLQITYGYFSSSARRDPAFSPERVLSGALARNARGSVLVSTRKLNRLKTLAEIAVREDRRGDSAEN
jgi:aryl-alcohol dehydrogenase-like predicted oxidoreductase